MRGPRQRGLKENKLYREGGRGTEPAAWGWGRAGKVALMKPKQAPGEGCGLGYFYQVTTAGVSEPGGNAGVERQLR